MSLASLPVKHVTNTRSPTTIGLDDPGPGSSIFQAIFSFGPHLTGSADSALAPLPRGPRKRGQSSALRVEVRHNSNTRQQDHVFMAFTQSNWHRRASRRQPDVFCMNAVQPRRAKAATLAVFGDYYRSRAPLGEK